MPEHGCLLPLVFAPFIDLPGRHDARAQEVLGVLYNVSKDYDHAVEAFKTVLRTK